METSTFVYDGDCAFCTQLRASSSSAGSPPRARVVPWQFADLDALGLTVAECEEAVQWVGADGSRAGRSGRHREAARRRVARLWRVAGAGPAVPAGARRRPGRCTAGWRATGTGCRAARRPAPCRRRPGSGSTARRGARPPGPDRRAALDPRWRRRDPGPARASTVRRGRCGAAAADESAGPDQRADPLQRQEAGHRGQVRRERDRDGRDGDHVERVEEADHGVSPAGLAGRRPPG